MKKSILIPFLILFISVQANAKIDNVLVKKIEINKPVQEKIKTITLKVTGMTCAGCSISLQKEIKSVEGVIENDVKYPGDIAIIKYDSTKITIDELVKVIENKGYIAEIFKGKV
jgi:periplasmic mercuric ion binding protein